MGRCRMLKLQLTDGAQSVWALEYSRVGGLDFDSAAGLKLVSRAHWASRR